MTKRSHSYCCCSLHNWETCRCWYQVVMNEQNAELIMMIVLSERSKTSKKMNSMAAPRLSVFVNMLVQ